jgi:tRNA-dihydrouridine synthase B
MMDLDKKEGAGIFDSSLLCLAPMAGYSDAPFRLLCAELGADFAVTEMVSAEGLVRGGGKTTALLRFIGGEGPVGIQLFGANPAAIASAASIAGESRPAFIDINFGCPVRKVVRKNGGSAIMRDLELMERIAGAAVEAVSIPVTAKIRSGWSEREMNFLEAGRALERAGVSAITLHPRTRSQGFGGEADWSQIWRLREELSIPVIANGNVRTVADYERIVSVTGPGIVMIGRGALGNPWIFGDIKGVVEGRPGEVRSIDDIVRMMERHVRMEVEWKGERAAIVEMRKQYRWYLRGIDDIKRYRSELSQAESLAETVSILEAIREECREKCKRPA